MIRELQLILIVKDEGMTGKLGCTQNLKDTRALLNLLRWRQCAFVDLNHGIVEIEP